MNTLRGHEAEQMNTLRGHEAEHMNTLRGREASFVDSIPFCTYSNGCFEWVGDACRRQGADLGA